MGKGREKRKRRENKERRRRERESFAKGLEARRNLGSEALLPEEKKEAG